MLLQEEELSDRVAIGDDHERQDDSSPQPEAIERGRDLRRRRFVSLKKVSVEFR
jgi:hypothetical protein